MKSGEAGPGELLLDGAWLPVTKTVLFVNATVGQCVDELITGVRGRYLEQDVGFMPFVQRPVRASSLTGLLETLLPLEFPDVRRMLFLPTANPEWSAMLTSAWRGFDASSPMHWFAMGGLASISVQESPHRPRLPGRQGSWGVRRIEMLEIPPTGEPIGHTLGVRSTSHSRWEVAGGETGFPIGHVWDPDAKSVRMKFTHDHLVQMCARAGLRPFDEDFYAPDGTGVLVERTDPTPDFWPIITLAMARGEEPTPF